MKMSVIGLLLVAAGLYFYNLYGTTVFIADVARDTTRSLEILKNKELTLIGPPASIGQYGTRNIFFGSYSLYLGALGLAIGGQSPVAANYVSAALFLLAVPATYALLQHLTRDFFKSFIGTVFFTLSPLTATHARFFWNANFLIPFAIFFALACVKRRYFIAGLLLGAMINFHYVAALYGLGVACYLIYKKQHYALVMMGIGAGIASLPLIFFEVRNEWYLTQAILFHLQNGTGDGLMLLAKTILRFFALPLTFIGLFPAEFAFPALLPWMKEGTYHARYLFPLYPLLVWGFAEAFGHSRTRIIGYALVVLMTMTSLRIITHVPELPEYIPLKTIEKVTTALIKDKPRAPYNITENIIGDARAISFRFFLLRDASVQPESIERYENLETLYVVAPSLEKVLSEKRWEFTATPHLELKHDERIDSVHLFVFGKKDI